MEVSQDDDRLDNDVVDAVSRIVDFLSNESENHFKSLTNYTRRLEISDDVLLKYGASIFESLCLKSPRMRESLRDQYPTDEKYDRMIEKKRSDFERVKTGKSKNLPDIAWDGLSMAVFGYKQKRRDVLAFSLIAHGAGLFVGSTHTLWGNKTQSDIISKFARAGALAKLRKDPVQAAKIDAHKLWQDWQRGKTIHRSAAAFDRFVIAQLSAITSTKTVERWRKEWGNQLNKK